MRRALSSVLELMRLQSEMNRIFEVLEAIEGEDESIEVEYAPAFDIFETPQVMVIEMDLAGIDPESLKLTAVGNRIVIEGKRGSSKRRSVHYHLLERSRGKFKRSILIDGAFNTHHGVAIYKKGVLRIEFPKVTDRRGAPHPIEIKEA